jgi:hypothetical protein
MDDLTSKTKLRISAAEMERRREAVRWADAHNRIEGQFPGPESESIYAAFVNGEIEFHEIRPRLQALHHRS